MLVLAADGHVAFVVDVVDLEVAGRPARGGLSARNMVTAHMGDGVGACCGRGESESEEGGAGEGEHCESESECGEGG